MGRAPAGFIHAGVVVSSGIGRHPVDSSERSVVVAASMQERLGNALRRLWPDYRWSPAETGRDRIYCADAGEYQIVVEWNNGSTILILARAYGSPDCAASAVGTSGGMTAEAIRRAYLDAALAWKILQAPPPAPSKESAAEIESDHAFFKRLGGLPEGK